MKTLAIATKQQKKLLSFYPAIKKVQIVPKTLYYRILNSKYNQWIKTHYERKGRGAVVFSEFYKEASQSVFERSWATCSTPSRLCIPPPRDTLSIFGNAVLLIPESRSYHSRIVEEYLIRTARTLYKHGYTVYVNCLGSEVWERESLGKYHLIFPSLEWLAHNAHLFSCIIGIRTGLFDFLAAAQISTKLIVLYDGSPNGVWFQSLYPMSAWGVDAKEMFVFE